MVSLCSVSHFSSHRFARSPVTAGSLPPSDALGLCQRGIKASHACQQILDYVFSVLRVVKFNSFF